MTQACNNVTFAADDQAIVTLCRYTSHNVTRAAPKLIRVTLWSAPTVVRANRGPRQPRPAPTVAHANRRPRHVVARAKTPPAQPYPGRTAPPNA